MAKRFHNPALADASGAKAYVVAQWNEATVKQRYDWIFEYDATSVAI
jgi:salicylate hydroxylase